MFVRRMPPTPPPKQHGCAAQGQQRHRGRFRRGGDVVIAEGVVIDNQVGRTVDDLDAAAARLVQVVHVGRGQGGALPDDDLVDEAVEVTPHVRVRPGDAQGER